MESKSPGQEAAFRKGVEVANQKLAELRTGKFPQFTLFPVLKRIDAGNAFAASTAVLFKFMKRHLLTIVSK